MKKVVWCLSLVLAMPSMAALSAERRDGAYYCTVKFAGGLAYNTALHQWEGTPFKPSGTFVVKVSFRQPTNSSGGRDRDEYDVKITEEGSSSANNCTDGSDYKPPFIDNHSHLKCNTATGQEYFFNFDNGRFTSIYVGGYVNGADNNNDTPSISGGVCTKIQ